MLCIVTTPKSTVFSCWNTDYLKAGEGQNYFAHKKPSSWNTTLAQ